MLKDIVVIELASVLAGPDVGMFFSELGAKVIKIENSLTHGDVTRTWKLPTEDKNVNISAYYSSVNWNKETLFINLKESSDQCKIHELIKGADMVIANFKKGDDIKFNMDYKTLKKINPTLIYGAITGFGNNDNRVAFDVVLQAESGFMSMNGTKESGVLKMPVALIDILAAHQLKEGLMLALIQRTKKKKSYFVEVSLYDTAISSLKNQASNWLMNHKIPEALGSLHPNIAPYGEIFDTKDKKQIVLAVGTDSQFKKLLELLETTEAIKNSKKYVNNIERVIHRKQLFEDIAPYFKKFNRKQLINLFVENDIPAGAIKNLKEVFDNPSAQKLVNAELIDGIETKRVRTSIFKIS